MSIFNDLANGLRDGLLTSDELNKRQEATEFCTMAKVACIAAAIFVATSAVFSILSGTFAGVVLGMVLGSSGLIIAHDTYQLFDNIQKIYDSAITELKARLTPESMKTHLSHGMIIGRPIIDQWMDSIHQERSTYS